MNRWRDVLGLAGWLAAVFAAAAAGSAFTASSVGDWYLTLNRPPWTPPSGLFGPVWTALYILMGAAAWLVWRQGGFAGAAAPLGLFLGQLALNVLWSGIFFGLRAPGLAAVEIVLLWLAIAATLAAFWRVKPMAGMLLIPYLLWVGFASVLNLAIWRLNR